MVSIPIEANGAVRQETESVALDPAGFPALDVKHHAGSGDETDVAGMPTLSHQHRVKNGLLSGGDLFPRIKLVGDQRCDCARVCGG